MKWCLLFSIWTLTLFKSGFSANKTVINIYALTTITLGEGGRGVVGSQRLHLDEINKNDSIFPDYEFTITPYDSQGDSVTALKYALQMIENEDNLILNYSNETGYTEVTLPIVLGAPWSSLSVITAPALGGFNFGMVSSAATSVLLSETGDFPFFYRTPPADNVQSAGVIKLCTEFGWDKIAIMYVNNNYGVYLAISILSLALQENIEAYSIPFEHLSIESYELAAKQISELGVLC